MADHPIIFSAPMIAALLAGRKTQTRRLLTLPKWASTDPADVEVQDDGSAEVICCNTGCLATVPVRFAVGDRLYVRENHALVPSSAYRMSEGVQQTVNPADRDEAAIYAAGWDRSKPRWRPSIHMPRWASRLTLLVTDVRVERLQDISRDDAMAEGIVQTWGDFGGNPPAWALREGEDESHFYDNRTSVENFRLLWESINGPEAWEANPWVVAITFSVHARNIDQLAPADALDIAGAA